MHPEQQVQAMLDIEARGWELAGIFHSHPNGPSVLSATDVRRAYYPEAVYLIISPDERGEWQGRGFHIEDGRVEAVPLRILG
jgi:proteasome lid subunit RPN8/RPN11